MLHTRYRGPEILEKYDAAVVAYQRDWEHIDTMMMGVIAENTERSPESIHTKVVLVDGVYRSQLSRKVGQSAQLRVATEILNCPMVLDKIDALSSRPLELSTFDNLISTHFELVEVVKRAIPAGKSRDSLRSFASKYLHFHADCAPIYDSLASGHISRFTDSPDFRNRTLEISGSSPTHLGSDKPYFHYVTKFLSLFEFISSLREEVSVKRLDHLLWSDNKETPAPKQ